MTITGLQNNYYLTNNDIWIHVYGLTSAASVLELTVNNTTTGQSLPMFKLVPGPANDFYFNIAVPVSALFPEPDHVTVNTLQSFVFNFVIKFKDSELPEDSQTVSKYFVLGGSNNINYLPAASELVVGRWIQYSGFPLPTYPKRIQGAALVDFAPSNPYNYLLKECDYKILKFRNSLGGYQYFLFEKYEVKVKTRAGKTIDKIAYTPEAHRFRNLGNEVEEDIKFSTYTPEEIQSVFIDLAKSDEVYLYNPDWLSSTLGSTMWQLLEQQDHDASYNNYDRMYENNITFRIFNRVNKRV